MVGAKVWAVSVARCRGTLTPSRPTGYSRPETGLESWSVHTPDVWSQSISLRWPPSIAFYENRFSFLRKLEERANLSAFRIDEENQVVAKVGDFLHEISLAPTGVSLSALGTDTDWEPCSIALDLALKAVQPTTVQGARLYYQHLVPLDLDYDSARRVAASRWFGDWRTSVNIIDHALLIDGVAKDPDVTYQIEFGIIERRELEPRLSRSAGRRVSARQVALPPQLDFDKAPDVGVFADSNWTWRGKVQGDEAVSSLVEVLRNTAHGLGVGLLESLSNDIILSIDQEGDE